MDDYVHRRSNIAHIDVKHSGERVLLRSIGRGTILVQPPTWIGGGDHPGGWSGLGLGLMEDGELGSFWCDACINYARNSLCGKRPLRCLD